MEDILDLYIRAYNEYYPLVCFDESSKQQLKETFGSIEMKKSKVKRVDYSYERNGVSNLFMMFEPLTGWIHVKVTDHHKREDWAECMKDLVDIYFPKAKKIILVEDNLNTHDPASLYKRFKPSEAKRIWDKIDFHFTPKHGSWLNMAEIAFSILFRECLNRRIPDQDSLKREISFWEKSKNSHITKVDWQFTTEKARINLKRLYPTILEDNNIATI